MNDGNFPPRSVGECINTSIDCRPFEKEAGHCNEFRFYLAMLEQDSSATTIASGNTVMPAKYSSGVFSVSFWEAI